MEDLYFYKGKFRTEEGLKRALIKDGRVTTSPKQNYYCYEDFTEYCYPYDALFDYAHDYEWCTEEELKHFRKWLNSKIKEGKISVVNASWYHCEENDNLGTTDFWETLEAILDGMWSFDPRYPDDYIESLEDTINNYVDTISDDEYNSFSQLDDAKQSKIAMAWRIKEYNKAINNN